jgi:hypothetical protein
MLNIWVLLSESGFVSYVQFLNQAFISYLSILLFLPVRSVVSFTFYNSMKQATGGGKDQNFLLTFIYVLNMQLWLKSVN